MLNDNFAEGISDANISVPQKVELQAEAVEEEFKDIL
jgi:hypothetical protein